MLAKVKIMAFNVASAGIGNMQHAEGSGCQLETGMGNCCLCLAGRRKMHYVTRADNFDNALGHRKHSFFCQFGLSNCRNFVVAKCRIG